MGKYLNLCVLLLGSALVFGCASQKNGRTGAEHANAVRYQPKYETALDALEENDPATGQKIVKKAHSAIGTPYVLGGTSPGGFDCSGLVKWTYNSVGVELPRTAREQSAVGQKIKNVEDMRAGDIVAFKHPKRGYHTGIYMGDGKFIHSPRKRTRVRINSLDDPYFSSTLLGARRINISSSDTLVAQAESRLEEFVSSRGASKTVAAKTAKAAAQNGKKSAGKAKTASKGKSVSVNSGKNSGKNAQKATSRKNTGKSAAAAKSGSKAKSVAGGKSAKKSSTSVKSVASAKTGSSKALSTGKPRHNAAAAKTQAAKPASQKAVSMLQKKAKSSTRSRNHS